MVRETTIYPNPIKHLIRMHYKSHKIKLKIFYCDTIEEVKKYAGLFDLSINTIRDPKVKTKTMTFYYTAYGMAYAMLANGKNNDIEHKPLGDFRIYYTKINKRNI